MTNQKNILAVQNLSKKLTKAKALVLADYQGLNVEQINELRNEVKKVGGEFEVVKNTLLHLAAKESQHPASEAELEGPTAALWAYEDDPSPFKALDTFIKKNDLPKIKVGFCNKETISLERIKQLANLPGRVDLEAKLVGTLNSPIFGLVNALNWNIRKLLLVLQAKAKKGGEN